MSNDNESRIEGLIKAQAADPASEELKRRVQRLAAFHGGMSTRKRLAALRVRFALAAACAGLALIAAIALAPSLSAAHTLSVLSDAMDGTTSLHLKMMDVTSGVPTLMHEVWYQNGAERVAGARGEITIWQNGVLYTYNPQAGSVTRQVNPNGSLTNHLHGFKMSGILEEMTGHNRGKNIEVSKPGGPTYRVQFDNTGVEERYIFIVDTKTDLPQTMEVETPKRGGWTKRAVGTFEFNQPLSSDLFKPSSLPSSKLIDLDAFRAGLAREFKNKVAFLTNGSKTGGLTIRHIDVTTMGHVFIVYTGSAATLTRWVELSDDRGTQYVRAELGAMGEFRDRDLTVQGLPGLSVSWWVPENGHGSFHPGKYMLVMKKQKEFDSPGPGQPIYAKVQTLGQTSFSVTKPCPSDVPPYMSLSLGIEVLDSELALKRGEAFSLFNHYLHRFVDKAGKPIDFHGMWDGGPTDGVYHDPKDLEKALAFATDELDLAREVAKQQYMPNPSWQAYDHLFMVTRLLGRISESDDYLKKAESLSDSEAKNAGVWIEYQTRIGNIRAGKR